MLKFIAALTMLLDHLSVIFLPQTSPLYWVGRIIGRLAMPIFAYYVAQGFIHTRHFKNYLTRIGIMTLCAQIPFIWFMKVSQGANLKALFSLTSLGEYVKHWNIGVTFICALLVLTLYEKSKEIKEVKSNLLSFMSYILGVFVCLLVSSFSDYGIYGIATVILFYMFLKKHLTMGKLALFMLLTTFLFMGPFAIIYQGPAVFSLLLIKYVPEDKIRLPKRFFYVFYPLHILILALLGGFFHL